MNKEGMLVFVKSQIVCAMIELEAMKAANHYREMRGEVFAYGETAFMSLINKYGIGHNTVIETLNK